MSADDDELPDGWREIRHSNDERAVFYYHEATQTACWSRPYRPAELRDRETTADQEASADELLRRHRVHEWMTAVVAPRVVERREEEGGGRRRAPRTSENGRAWNAAQKTPTAFLHEWAAHHRLAMQYSDSVTPPDISIALIKPFQSTIAVSDREFVGHGESKKLAKHSAADAALRHLAPEHWPSTTTTTSTDTSTCTSNSDAPASSNQITERDFLGAELTPLQMINRYSQITGVAVHMSVDRVEAAKGYHATGSLSNGLAACGDHRKVVTAKHMAALSLLAQLHPSLTTYSHLLDLYTRHSLSVADLVCSSTRSSQSTSSPSVLAALRAAMAELVEQQPAH